ncbi:MSHA pilin protein MshD [Duganella sp. CF517]|uniref:type IV pilus modification PilV family protein n=1 Tax=Duganella sp. CF517 TaxID=1881038 RepID=UPI0008B53D1C|nr:prepilin-type N-terminal cleavage/methylation domain-containing protein [Duganella sp. CF517]SEN91470.1 MSHA pilin protein MshD [Duganella sp. CF517]
MFAKHQRGLTLIELVLFMVIMGVAAAGIIGVLNIGAKASADPLRRKQAMLIAEAFMEEVQLARFTFCVPGDANESTATDQNGCSTPANAVAVRPRPAGMARPYENVADYATALNAEEHTFAVNGVDTDVNLRALGRDAALNQMGNSSLGPITTTVTLNLVPAGAPLGPTAGPANLRIDSATSLEVLQITIITRYGGPNDVIRLDGFRTRYAPNN